MTPKPVPDFDYRRMVEITLPACQMQHDPVQGPHVHLPTFQRVRVSANELEVTLKVPPQYLGDDGLVLPEVLGSWYKEFWESFPDEQTHTREALGLDEA